MRAFIGIEIPEELKREISKIQKRFEGFDIKLVERQNLHFCLKFLGEISEEDAIKVKENLPRFDKFKVKVHGTGVFPHLGHIKVIWLGVKDGKNEMIRLAKGFGAETFEAHLTLGRVKSGRNKSELIKLLEELKDKDIGEFEVSEVFLIKSELTSLGPVYEKL